MTAQEAKSRALKIQNQLAKLRRRAQDMTQTDIFGGSNAMQDSMFGGTLPEIRQRVNDLEAELRNLEVDDYLVN